MMIAANETHSHLTIARARLWRMAAFSGDILAVIMKLTI